MWLWLPNFAADDWIEDARAAPMASERPFGVNLAGFLSSESGLGESARLRAEALAAAKIPTALNNVPHPDLENRERPGAPVTEDNPYRVNLVWVNAPETEAFARRAGPAYFAGRYSIAYWVWEMPEMPDEWRHHFRYYDEIWVPTRFVEACVAPRAPVPVTCIPHPIRPARIVASEPDRSWRARAGVADDAFVFLFVFHFHAVFERKNPLDLIAAYARALPRERDAVLVIKTAGGAGSRQLASMREAARGLNVRILDQVMRRDEVDRLVADCDAYVSLHRSEGFGLTLAEAMTYGKPVIATGHGGNTDFMTDDNSYLVRHRLVALDRDVGPYRKGWHWAAPDVDHAAALIRRVYERRDEASAIGARGRADVERALDPARVGAMMRARLDAIARNPAPRARA